jgi:methionyl-tRNA formyltransferase
VEQKILKNIDVALDNWLPELQSGIWNPIPQNESEASWLGIRKPEDGRIDWSMAASSIDRLIKASSKPHPGAYTYFNDSKVLIWKSELEESIPIKGVVGRVLLKDDKRGLLIQCGIGLVWLLEIETESRLLPAVGDKLGFAVEDEIYRIKMLLKNRNI